MAESEAAYAKETAAYANVIKRAWSDPAFKAQLLADPRAALGAAGAPVPHVAVRVVENTERFTHLNLPPQPAETELPNEALETAAGECFCERPHANVVARAWRDHAFKTWLLADPHAALAAVGEPVPSGMTFKVVESTDKLVHFILPHRPAQTALSDEVLKKAAAGAVCSHIVNVGPQPHH
jgi:hypothetical protein